MKKMLCLTAFVVTSIHLWAYYNYSEVCSSGQTLYYYLSSSNHVATIVPPNNSLGSSGNYYSGNSSPSGNLVIPSSVVKDGVTYPVQEIGDHAFYWCDITSVSIPGTVTTIGEKAFGGCRFTSVSIPNSVQTIRKGAFAGSTIRTISLPNTLVTIPEHCFDMCGDLTSINIPSSVRYIDDYAFYGTSLTSFHLPDNLCSIGDYAFYVWSEIESSTVDITLPSSLYEIGDYAFGNIIFRYIYASRSTPPTIHRYTFPPVSHTLTSVYVPQGSLSAYENDTYWGDFQRIYQRGIGISDKDVVNASLIVTNQGLKIDCEMSKMVYLYDLKGILIEKVRVTSVPCEISVPKTGLYLVKVGDCPAQKVVVIK